MDVGAGVMDEYAGLHISGRIDMCVLPPSCNTSVDIFAVILEVNAENLLTTGQATDLANSVDHILSLLCVQHQIHVCTITDRHIMEVPVETDAVADQHVDELVACNSLVVLTRITNGSTIKQSMLLHQIHCMHHLVEYALPTTVICCIPDAFDGNKECHISDLLYLLTELLIDQGSVGEQMEY